VSPATRPSAAVPKCHSCVVVAVRTVPASFLHQLDAHAAGSTCSTAQLSTPTLKIVGDFQSSPDFGRDTYDAEMVPPGATNSSSPVSASPTVQCVVCGALLAAQRVSPERSKQSCVCQLGGVLLPLKRGGPLRSPGPFSSPLPSAFRTGNLQFAYCHTDVGLFGC
jgi:hypothetical protein